MAIYKEVSYRKNLDGMKESINKLTNPICPFINSYVSRIKRAFCNHFDDSLAKIYYIRGEWGEPKFITLDRQLVTWQTYKERMGV